MGIADTKALFVRLMRIAGWLGLVGIVALSLAPGHYRPHTFMPPRAEHFFAYGLTAFVLGLGYISNATRLKLCIGLALAAGVFEILQRWVPGRSPHILDWAASTAGACAGMTLALAIAVTIGSADSDPRA
jgi:VanZ family protein